jgi:DNA mismatch repair protein MutL
MLIDIQRAWERIYYERFVSNYEKGKILSQQELFPQLIHFTHTEASIVAEIKPELHKLGFVLEPAGVNVFAIQGTPIGIEHADSKELLTEIIEQYRITQQEPLVQSFHGMALALARKVAPTRTVAMPAETLTQLIDQLFACQVPTTSPDGKKIVRILETGMLAEYLK